MKVIKHDLPRSTLEKFADKHDLVMEVRERNDKEGSYNRYYAMFQSVEVSEGALLRSAYGDGATIEKAIESYMKEISGQLIIVDAFRSTRREIVVPILTGVK